MGGLKYLAAMTLAFPSDNKGFPAFLNSELLKGFQVLFNVSPFKIMPGSFQSLFKLLFQHQSQKVQKTWPLMFLYIQLSDRRSCGLSPFITKFQGSLPYNLISRPFCS